MAEHETIADVIAEMHRFAKQHEYDHPDMNTNAQGIEDYADRLEAAHKRERGDAAKLRERRLLMSCARWILCHDIYGHTAKELLAECKEVLNDDGQFLFKEDEQ